MHSEKQLYMYIEQETIQDNNIPSKLFIDLAIKLRI